MPYSESEFDLAVVGAGIVGLGCALAAARRGLKVLVIERDARCCGASVRNFGLITITGQEPAVWRRARRAREIWEEVSLKAGIAILQKGLWLAARAPEAVGVLEAFLRSDMAEGCELLSRSAARRRTPMLRTAGLRAVLFSPHELRVESREAIPRLADWLAHDHGVTFYEDTAVHAVEPPWLETSRGRIRAASVAVCPGDDRATLYPEHLSHIHRCTLQMLRLESPGFSLPAAVMSDLSLLRYGGFSQFEESAALRRRLEREQPEYLRHGIHLIVVQGADGTLVVGDSHHYDVAPLPFAAEAIDDLLRAEYAVVIGRAAPPVRERWTGTYATADGSALLLSAPAPRVRLAVITSGVGASIGFAVGEEVIEQLFD